MEEQSKLQDYSSPNTGLWYERYFNGYTDNIAFDKTSKLAFLKNICKDANQKSYCGNSTSIASFAERQIVLVESLHGHTEHMQCSWNFVTGLGNPHPVENSMQWHPLLGTPYLPASSVKGLLRAWLELHYLPKDAFLKLFGSENKEPSLCEFEQRAGSLIFFDAIPIQPVELVIDTMTPHMGQWYDSGAECPGKDSTVPADWHAPVPIPFLAAKNIVLQFSVASRQKNRDSGKTENLLKFACSQMKNALKHLGSGAKTAAGYGHMIECNSHRSVKNLHDGIAENKALVSHQSLSLAEKTLEDFRLKAGISRNCKPETGGDFHDEIIDQLDSVLHEETEWSINDQEELLCFAVEFFQAKKKHTSKNRREKARKAIDMLKERLAKHL